MYNLKRPDDFTVEEENEAIRKAVEFLDKRLDILMSKGDFKERDFYDCQ
jgi:hypothetical protein